MEGKIKWQTGKPQYTGKYLITDKYGHTNVDYWYNTNDAYKGEAGWYQHYEEDVIAWCELCEIEPYKK